QTTDNPAPQTQPEPFRRGQITWGRPPQAAFHVGPLPRDEGLARLTAMPPHPKPSQARPAQTQPADARPTAPAGRPSGVFGGSMVPRRQPAPTASAPQSAAPPAPQAAPAPAADLTPRPLPDAAPQSAPV